MKGESNQKGREDSSDSDLNDDMMDSLIPIERLERIKESGRHEH